MTIKDGAGTIERAPMRTIGPLLLIFAGSGAAALIYEIVWYQLLEFAIGSTAVSLGVLLATFMGGLCIGSLALPRLIAPDGAGWRHPLAVYAIIEFAIAGFGLIELVAIPLIGGTALTGPQAGFAGMLLRAAVAGACLLPPTVLMGASLPAIVRWVKSSGQGVSWWGFLYGANTLGAVAGALFAGFYLLRVFDLNVATFAAAAINGAAGLIGLVLAWRFPSHAIAQEKPDVSGVARGAKPDVSVVARSAKPDWTVHVAIALSGATALGAEVVWTRLMGLMLGATVYSFSIILAVFLAGLALGTAAGSTLARDFEPKTALGWCQLLAAAGIAWTAYMIADWLPYWPINPMLTTAPQFVFQIDLVRSVWALLPATLCWGASFPFAFAAASDGGDSGKTVSGVYAANTFGAIFGALIASLVLIPAIGTQNTQRVLMGAGMAGGLILLLPRIWKTRAPGMEIAAGIAVGLLCLMAWGMDAVPGVLIAYGRRIATVTGQVNILYTAEGRNTSIAVTTWNDGELQFHVAGKVEASTEIYDMRLQRMLGHLPGLVHKDPKSVLVVGFGAGVTAGTFTTYPDMKRIVICELEPIIPPVTTHYFAKQNYDVLHDKRTEMVYDDARHFVASTPEKFDVITSDPIHPFVKGSAALYTKEYFETVKAHLNPGGVVTQWVPLYETDAATVKSEIATFFEVFPHGTIWANNIDGSGYDIVLLGSDAPLKIDLDALAERFDSPAYAKVKDSLADVKMNSPNDMFATYAGDAADLKPWLKDAQVNHDRDLRLQYLAGLALNHAEEDTIYLQMMQYWAPPAGLFTGSPERMDALFKAMAKPKEIRHAPLK